MSKKYIRPGGMCQFFDEHYHYFGGIDWDRIDEDHRGSTKDKNKPPEEPYYARIARIQALRAEKAAKKKAAEKEEITYKNF